MPQPAVSPTVARKQNPNTLPDPANDLVRVKLRRLFDRKAKGMTDQEIAEAAGMKKQALSRIMTGSTLDPGILTITTIVRAIGATLCDYDRA
jgi:DNA-binding phage protein